ncbi:kinesin-like protein [Achlya hypogyna]|uniref:Kinesin-like protein n=1 Tax=Achlya hypogyna TaxID=1202772 RepID=A0A1V9YQ76_ACHHY|nr:kinesin-like protein [Achlya hypogyna]
MDAQRALLDELMGRNRDGDKPQEDIRDFRDARVCKRFLCGLCPHDLFQNTKMDMGDCPKLHLPKLKAAYDADPAKREYGYEADLERELVRYVSDVEKKISRALKRLDEQDGARVSSMLDFTQNKDVLELTAEIAELMQKAEDAGNEGEVDLSMRLMAKVETLKHKKAALQGISSSATSGTEAVIPEYDHAQMNLMQVLPGNPLALTNVNQKLRVCDMCGALLSIFDSDRRLADHFGGKMHLGYMQIRKKIQEMREARGNTPLEEPKTEEPSRAPARQLAIGMEDCVHVCVRVRPVLNKKGDAALPGTNCIRVPPSATPTQLIVGKDRPFTFDTILTAEANQAQLYDTSVASLVTKFMEGYNATVLAYGQTGSGKTHTMSGGGAYSTKIDASHGVIPRAVCHVFRCMQEKKHVTEFLLRVEYLEIYNEELRDLLHPETSSKQLSIREDANGHIVVAGAQSRAVQTPEDVMRLLSMGTAARVTGSTNMNEQSSRSHAIFTLMLQQRDLGTGEFTLAKFHLVDLAGSERAKRTGAVGGRFKESININQGLLALGNVISALGDEAKKKLHVPYRDSKLTRLLQDSLGGNSTTLMIACVSPAAANFEETLNTLKYANRAKNIKNRPVVNHVVENEQASMIARMKSEIQELQQQLQSQAAEPEAADSTREALEAEQAKSRSYKRLLREAKASAKEAATALVALERDVKTLGRPAQQRLNDVVKALNGILQLAPGPANVGDVDTDAAHAEILSLKEKLKQDVEIFNLKAKDMETLQQLMLKMKAEFDTTVLVNAQLQAANAALEARVHSLLAPKTSPARVSASSKSLFRQRHQPAEEDDCVLMDDPAEDNNSSHGAKEADRPHTVPSPNQRQLPSPISRVASAPSRRRAEPTKDLDLMELFQKQLQAALDAKEATEQLESLAHDKEETERQIHDIALRKTDLEMEKMRQSLTVQHSISDLSATIHAMNQKMTSLPDADDVARLRRRKERAEKKLALLMEKNEAQAYLEPGAADELATLEEQIADLTSQILFQDAQLETAKSSQAPKVTPLHCILKALGVHKSIDSKLLGWLRLSWTELVTLASSARGLQAKILQQEELITQLSQTRVQLEQGLAAARAEYDRRFSAQESARVHDARTIEELTLLVAEKSAAVAKSISAVDDKALADMSQLLAAKQAELETSQKALLDADKDKKRLVEYDRYIGQRQAEWEEHMRSLKEQLAAAKDEVQRLHASTGSPELAALQAQYSAQQEYIGNLEKHVVLFKTKAKQTQQQLQQLIRDSSNQLDRPDPRVAQLEEMNDRLLKENAAMKVHLCGNNDEPHTVRIRVPKTELQEVAIGARQSN